MTSLRFKAMLLIGVMWALGITIVYPMIAGETAYARPLATCPTNSGHCYGVVTWPNGILGAITWINTVHLYSVNNGSDHISEELWLLDTSHGCSGSSASWVETGEATRVGYNGNWYFWADCRPGSSFYPHWVSSISSGYGTAYEYLIDSSGGGNFQVDATNTSTGSLLFSGTSTSNSMSANLIEVGLETTNNSYSITHADNDYFTHNQYHGLNGVWNYQGNGGQVSQNQPPYWYWNVTPAGGNAGGQGETTCC